MNDNDAWNDHWLKRVCDIGHSVVGWLFMAWLLYMMIKLTVDLFV